jgi:iron complex outermembrane receptor protein
MKPSVCARAHCLRGRVFFLISLLAGGVIADESREGIETIEVIGTSVEEQVDAERLEIFETPGGVSLIDGDSFYERSIGNLADALRYVPGFWSASQSGNDTIFFSSRGSNLDATDYDMNGIKLLQDGLPITSADGNNHNRIVDPMSARYAVVARGANALTYGASTLGGAVNFLTPTAEGSPPVDLYLNGGSHGDLAGRATFSRLFDDGLDGMATFEGKTWDGYRDHNDQDRFGVYANGGWRVSGALATRFYFNWVDNDRELPGTLSAAEIDADPDQASASAIGGNFQINVETWRIANRTSWQIDADRRMEFGLSYEHQTLFHPIVDRIMVDFDGPGPLEPVEVFSLLVDTDHEDLGAMVRYSWQTGDHDLLFGANVGVGSVDGGNYRNLGGHRNGLSEEVDNDARSIELFATDRWRLGENWTLVAAAQGVFANRDVATTDVATGAVRNPEDDYSGFNPRLGLIWGDEERASVFASVSRLFEAPTTFELEDDVRGNEETLDPMRGTVVEVGSRGEQALGGGDVHWEVSLYYAWIDDEILSVDDPAAPGTSLSTNVDDTVHAGVEALLGGEFSIAGSGEHRLAPLLSISLNHFEFDDDPVYGDNELPAAPDFAVRGELLYRHAAGFYFGPTFDFIGERWADFVNSYKVDDYALLGLRAGWSDARWRVWLEARNLLDEEYIASHSVRDVAGPDDAILNPGEPLSAYAGLQLRF